jgi:SAM-dependent methyltransferase
MPKAGEKTYFGAIGTAGISHAVAKPFSDEFAGALLAQIGTIMQLLPPPPARLLDLGCGTGWTSVMFAQRGYEVVGQDISDEAIDLANLHNKKLKNLSFVVSDFESMKYTNEFDCAVFFESLHHAENVEAALKKAHKALKIGGVCVAAEPGIFHSKSPSSKKAVADYGVTERDMPPSLIIKCAKKAGFRKFKVYPDTALLQRLIIKKKYSRRPLKPLKYGLVKAVTGTVLVIFKKRIQGIVVLQK